jgi:hypothetical protein
LKVQRNDEILVISAHYDHVGVKMVMSIMALMTMAQEQLRCLKLPSIPKAKDGHGPKRSIMFCM